MQVEDKRMCFNQPWMCLVYLKEKGEEAYASSAALTVPGHVTTHRLGTEGGEHTSKCVLDYCGVLVASQSQDCSSD